MKPRRWLCSVASAGLVAALVVVVGPAPSAAGYPNPTVDFLGHGWGHGRGMGQFGALGYAVDRGYSWEQILDHYYGGTRMADLAGGDNAGMSVRIMDRNGQDTIVAGQVLVDGEPDSAPPHAAVRVQRVSATQWNVFDGPGCAGPWSPVPYIGSPNEVALRPASASEQLTICLSNTTGQRYYGTVKAAFYDNAQVTVNNLTMGLYLQGVLPYEVSGSWSDLGAGSGANAVRAQAVAARSYSWSENRYTGVAKTCDTTACQVYRGLIGEHANTNAAVTATAGKIRELIATGVVARTEYSSSTGGWTAGGTFPAVEDLGDTVCISGSTCNPNHTWTAKIPVGTVEAKYAKGRLDEVTVLTRNGLGTEGGRVRTVRLTFSGGVVEITGDDLRRDLGLKSDWYSIVNVASFPYHVVARDGGVFAFGGAVFHGSLPGAGVRTPARDMTEGPGGGYWILGEDGGVFSFDVPFHGSLGGQRLNKPVAGIQASATAGGYWLVAGDGGIFSFGDAPFHGSTGSMPLNKPVVGMAPTPDGAGYWLVATDGGIFAFGAAGFFGSTGGIRLNQPVFAVAASPSGQGYWLVARDGGIFTFGDAQFHGSLPQRAVAETAVELLPSPSGGGYMIATAEGRVHAFGDASTGGGPKDYGSNAAVVGAGIPRP